MLRIVFTHILFVSVGNADITTSLFFHTKSNVKHYVSSSYKRDILDCYRSCFKSNQCKALDFEEKSRICHLIGTDSLYTLQNQAEFEHANLKGSVPFCLVDGNQNSGRLVVQIKEQWGTICDDNFTPRAARVACRSMGLPWQHAYRFFFGEGTGPIWLDIIYCEGKETSLLDCNTNAVGIHDCSHTEDVGLVCTDNKLQIRLVNGFSQSEGRIEVNMNNQWGTVCDDYWDALDAQVVCSMLGYDYSLPTAGNFFGMGSGNIFMDDVQCTGNEISLGDCDRDPFASHDCDHSEDAGVICLADEIPIRLVNGTYSSGRLEVQLNGQWGTVCDDNFPQSAARVACNSMGLPWQHAYISFFGEGKGPILFDGITCQGNETSLLDCNMSTVGSHDCLHNEDVGLVCTD